MARKHIPFVIAYDFDGTLASGNMQEYDFIPTLKMDIKAFWEEVGEFAKQQEADAILAYMQLMLHKAAYKNVPIRKQDFRDFGSNIELFPGVDTWFKRINQYGRQHDIKVQHFIVSSGLREMVAGTKIAKEFSKIFASGFMYDQHNVAFWPALAVNYTTKTQYLFRINKGCLDVHDNSQINKFVPHRERPVPFSNIVFVGDGETDIPCMRLVKEQGGHSIAVYETGKRGRKNSAKRLVKEGRVTLATPANYTEGSAIDKAVKAMIDTVVAKRILAEVQS